MPTELLPPHSTLPFRIQPCVADHGKSTVIVDERGFVVATIPSAAWKANADLKYPHDRGNAALILCAVNSFYPMKAALKNLYDVLILQQRISQDGDPDLQREFAEQVRTVLNEADQLLRELTVSGHGT